MLRSWGLVLRVVLLLGMAILLGDFIAARLASAASPVERSQPSTRVEKLRGAAALTQAKENVAEALQREIYGLSDERSELLQEAALLAPELPAPRWMQGMMRNERSEWQSVDDMLVDPLWQKRLAKYERKRSEFLDTPNEQLQLAEWCLAEKLHLQARGHLERVIELDPDHAVARRMLGFQNIEGRWTTEAELAAGAIEQSRRAASVKKYRVQLQKIVEKLVKGSQIQREAAKKELLALRDVEAVFAVEAIVSTSGQVPCMLAIEWLATIPETEASRSLARHAVMHDSLFIREEAAKLLQDRDLHSYVPLLLASMVTPIRAEWAVVQLEGGRIGTQQVFVRETQDRREIAVAQAEFVREQNSGNRGRRYSSAERNAIRQNATERAQAEIAAEIGENLSAAEAENRITQQINDRICWVLSIATSEDKIAAEPSAWWDWWTKYNEFQTVGTKATTISQEFRQVEIIDRQIQPGFDSPRSTQVSSQPLTGGFNWDQQRRPKDCLVAGTPVWTARGPVAVEKIQVGDLIYTQDTKTGELALRPATSKSTRPAGKLIKIDCGGETISCSGGHVFWVAGEGWKKASDLQSGMVLHSLNGSVRVSSVDEEGVAETYNLVVADFHSYFVGSNRLLSHDLTMREPVSTLVPGLPRP